MFQIYFISTGKNTTDSLRTSQETMNDIYS